MRPEEREIVRELLKKEERGECTGDFKECQCASCAAYRKRMNELYEKVISGKNWKEIAEEVGFSGKYAEWEVFVKRVNKRYKELNIKE